MHSSILLEKWDGLSENGFRWKLSIRDERKERKKENKFSRMASRWTKIPHLTPNYKVSTTKASSKVLIFIPPL